MTLAKVTARLDAISARCRARPRRRGGRRVAPRPPTWWILASARPGLGFEVTALRDLVVAWKVHFLTRGAAESWLAARGLEIDWRSCKWRPGCLYAIWRVIPRPVELGGRKR